MNIEFSIIIPHHHDEKNLEALLDSLQGQNTKFLFEVLIVSNPGSAKASRLAAKDPRFINIDISDIGVNRARNKGILSSKSDLLFFLDSDCILNDSDLVQKHYDFHQNNPKICCLGGMYENSSLRKLDVAYNYLQNRWLLSGSEGETSNHLIGGHFSCKKSLLKEQHFDEEITYGGSETEWFYRLKKMGCISVLNGQLKVGHRTKLKISDFLKKHYRQGQGARYLANKHNYEAEGRYSGFQSLSFHSQYYSKDLDFYIFLAEEAFLMGKESEKSRMHLLGQLQLYFSRRIRFLYKKTMETLRALFLFIK